MLQVMLIIVIFLMLFIISGIWFVRNEPDNYEPRWHHRAYAVVHGYQWVSCPICNEPYGMHETVKNPNSIVSLEKQENSFIKVCSLCTDIAEDLRESNKKVTPQTILKIRNEQDVVGN